jgi:hypothetical protein
MNIKLSVSIKACILATGLLLSTTALADDEQDMQDLYEFNATQEIMAGKDSPIDRAQAGAADAAPIELATYHVVNYSLDLGSKVDSEMSIAEAGLAEDLNNLSLEDGARTRLGNQSAEVTAELNRFNKASIYAPMVGAHTAALRVKWKRVRGLHDTERHAKYAKVHHAQFDRRAAGLQGIARDEGLAHQKATKSVLSTFSPFGR